ncbi:hypothetical protein [Spirosoma sp.]|uniref:hypothetical protein n=1 Tax=Spirosoma sp. TaxID=1899569 RepID=UPI00261A4EFB|nr:hypothetical protein [Spirosoma sp.]MCX6216031.1 hypothetical protein [Spirosoma sp.]
MFDMNPLNLPDAQLQQLIMLVVAAVLGFIIGYVSRRSTIKELEGILVTTERDLDDCYRQTPVVADTDDEEAIVLNRIRSRSSEVNFGRIGMASAIDADNLKVIVGIGPYLEKKLNAIGIYTFRQIANFAPEDIEQVNDIIEFFPGRIERDNWVGQAADLVNKK